MGASVADAGSVGGTSVAGGPGDAVPAASRLGVGVPSMLMLVVEGRLTKNTITAAATTSNPSTSATHGQRLDGSSR